MDPATRGCPVSFRVIVQSEAGSATKERSMAKETQTQTGRCPTHGTVEATREVPRPHFPFVVYGIRRVLANQRPYRCPTCGEPVTTT
jgi:endogenous inhibitor of DNA gyrase (YacG/DUF329 family)